MWLSYSRCSLGVPLPVVSTQPDMPNVSIQVAVICLPLITFILPQDYTKSFINLHCCMFLTFVTEPFQRHLESEKNIQVIER